MGGGVRGGGGYTPVAGVWYSWPIYFPAVAFVALYLVLKKSTLGWALRVTDSTPELQQPGAIGVSASSTELFGFEPVTVYVDDLTAVVHGGELPVLPVGLTLLPNPLVHVAVVSAFVERPMLQSTSWSITTLK